MQYKSTNKLFVYGSLRSGFKSPAYEYLSSYFEYSGIAKTKAYFFQKDNVPVAVSTPDENFIVGELYTLKNEEEFSWAFTQLDDYEGLNVLQDETPKYQRREIEIYQNEKVEKAWVYWYNESVIGLERLDINDLVEYFANKK